MRAWGRSWSGGSGAAGGRAAAIPVDTHEQAGQAERRVTMRERRTGSLSTRLMRNALLAAALLIAHRLLSPTVALAASKPEAGKPDLHKAAVAGRYGLLIAAGALIVPTVAAYLISRSQAEKDRKGPLGNGFRRLIVGEDQRVSTSKTAAVIWTLPARDRAAVDHHRQVAGPRGGLRGDPAFRPCRTVRGVDRGPARCRDPGQGHRRLSGG